MRKEISINFLGIIFFGIYLIIKRIFFEDTLEGNSLLSFILAGALILLGLFGLLVI